jgi:hypothetical protein
MVMRWLLLCALLGCSLRQSDAWEAAQAPVAAKTASDSSAEAPGTAGASSPPGNLAAERMVIREASLRLRSKDPKKAADEAARIAAAVGGFVLESELRTVSDQVHEVEVQLRVPQHALDPTLKKLRGLGALLLENVSGQDVTEEFVDVQARLRAERALEVRLLSLLQGSAALKDLLAVEQELARVRGDIEQKEGRIRYLEERTRMASIQIVVEAPDQPLMAPAQSIASRLGNAFRRSLELAISVTEFFIQAAGAVLPLLLLALGATIVLRRLVVKRARTVTNS